MCKFILPSHHSLQEYGNHDDDLFHVGNLFQWTISGEIIVFEGIERLALATYNYRPQPFGKKRARCSVRKTLSTQGKYSIKIFLTSLIAEYVEEAILPLKEMRSWNYHDILHLKAVKE